MSVRLRPRFGLRVRLSEQEVMDRFRDCIEADNLPCQVSLLDRQIEISVQPEERHFWSPFLNMLLETDESHTLLQGKFGPNVNVWTMFLAAYALLLLTGTLGVLIATSQFQLGQTLTGLYLSAAALLVAAAVWGAGQLGKRWAYDQMVVIHHVVHNLFDDVLADEVFCEVCEDNELPSISEPIPEETRRSSPAA